MKTFLRFPLPALALMACFTALVSAPAAHAQAGATFLTIDGIIGESVQKGFEGSIDIFSFSWGAWAANVSNSTGAGARAGRPELQDLSLMKHADSTSPELFFRTMTGEVIPTAKVQVVRRSGDQQQIYFTLELKNVTITTVQHSHSSGGDFPMESVTLAYNWIKITHVASDGKVTERTWDLAKARGL